MVEGLEEFTEVTPVLSAGIYALVWVDEIVYIGRSLSMYQRIYSHARGKRRNGIRFDKVFVWRCRPSDLDRLEYQLIQKHKPRYNVSLKRQPGPPIRVTIRGVVLDSTKPLPVQPYDGEAIRRI